MLAQSVPMDDVPLAVVPGNGKERQALNDTPGIQVVTCFGHADAVPSCDADRDFRKLAICSIICGLSCIGIVSLINSVKAKETRKTDPEKAQLYSQKAKKNGIISIVVWVAILIFTPVLTVLVSYLLTLRD